MTFAFKSFIKVLSRPDIRKKIFSVTEDSFENLAMDLFHYQFNNNEVYRQYCSLSGRHPENVTFQSIPFLPVELFKTHPVITGNVKSEKIFESSATTSAQVSRHYIGELAIYEESLLNAFLQFFGKPDQYCIVALLPSYADRNQSSLVYMVDFLMKKSTNPESRFFQDIGIGLQSFVLNLEKNRIPTLLIGVSFALLAFAEEFPMQLHHTQIIETGGMKGRREEITREELHNILKTAFGLKSICSEYGMTELLSQAYSIESGLFNSPPWMKIFIRDINDPLSFLGDHTTGGINIIDLANLDSCGFIATSDLGRRNGDRQFEVLGRIDYSDIRGCNLMWD